MSTRVVRELVAILVALGVVLVAVVVGVTVLLRGGSGSAGPPGTAAETREATRSEASSVTPAPDGTAEPAPSPSRPSSNPDPDASASPGAQDEQSGPAQGEIQGESYTSGSGIDIARHSNAEDDETLGFVNDGDWAAYEGVSVEGATALRARVAAARPGARVQVRSGSPDGPVLGEVDVPQTGDWNAYEAVSIPLVEGGDGDLVLTFSGEPDSYLVDIDSFTLVR